MDVILKQDLDNLGYADEVVKVKAGYARNYLFPQRLAIPLTQANKRRIEVLRQRTAKAMQPSRWSRRARCAGA